MVVLVSMITTMSYLMTNGYSKGYGIGTVFLFVQNYSNVLIKFLDIFVWHLT